MRRFTMPACLSRLRSQQNSSTALSVLTCDSLYRRKRMSCAVSMSSTMVAEPYPHLFLTFIH
ncbi:hypothetical protein [Pantoea wallisii]|uniref:hypothetical protein n=1 Tax=Pantoea wallisii TaxID=1076551 RepID=UPI000FFB3F62|nr:hypothetical protein [Pantoea wallisii]